MMDENLLTPLEDPSRPFPTLDSPLAKGNDDFVRSLPLKDQPLFLSLLLGTESPSKEVNPSIEDDQGDEEDERDEGDEGEEELARGDDQQLPLCYLENELYLLGSGEPSQGVFYPSPSLDSWPIDFKNSPLSLEDNNSFGLDEHLRSRKLLTSAETPQVMFFTPGAFIQATISVTAGAASIAAAARGSAYAGDSIAYESLGENNGVAEEENDQETTEGNSGQEEGVWKWDERREREGTPGSATVTVATPWSATTKEEEEDQYVSKYADRHDRKDSGFFMHDEEEGVFVQVCPRPKSCRQAQRRAPVRTTTTSRATNSHSESDSSDWYSDEEEKEGYERGEGTMHIMHMYTY